MGHPLGYIPLSVRRRIFLPLLIATILIFAVWVLMVIPMANEKAPLNVSSFGMAGSVANAREMIATWDERHELSVLLELASTFYN